MSVQTPTVTEFLEARLSDREADAHKIHDVHEDLWNSEPGGLDCACGEPTRVLAECAAMRLAVEASWDAHLQIEDEWGSCRSPEELESINAAPKVVKALASIWADHPDFREEWRI